MKAQFTKRAREISKKQLYFLCSYPKCGRTWLRYIISNYFNLIYDLNIQLDLHTMFSIIPNDGWDLDRGIDAYLFFDDQRIPLIIASHSPYNPIKFNDGDVIFMFRSVYDVLVSQYFHKKRRLRDYKGDIKSFIRNRKLGVVRYVNYLNSWTPQLMSRRSFVLTYEGLYHDPEMIVSNLLSFLDIPKDPQILCKAISMSSFESMKQIEL